MSVDTVRGIRIECTSYSTESIGSEELSASCRFDHQPRFAGTIYRSRRSPQRGGCAIDPAELRCWVATHPRSAIAAAHTVPSRVSAWTSRRGNVVTYFGDEN